MSTTSRLFAPLPLHAGEARGRRALADSAGLMIRRVTPADENGDKPGELFLIDGNSLAYRAFFALPESIATSDGRPTNAIYGFASMMVKILTDFDPRAVAVAWDAGWSGREKVYKPYKAQRSSRPDLLKEQWPHLAPLADAFGFANVRVEGWEADDVIATLVAPGRREGHPGDGRLRRPRRLPAGRRRGPGHVDLARRHRHEDLRHRGGDRALRRPAGARPRPDRAQGRHLRQHPRRPRDRREDGLAAAAAVRLGRGGARQHRRDLGPEAQAEPDRARRGRPDLQAARDDALRHRDRARPRRS